MSTMSPSEEMLELMRIQTLAAIRTYDVLMLLLNDANPETAKQLEAMHSRGEYAIEKPWEVQDDTLQAEDRRDDQSKERSSGSS